MTGCGTTKGCFTNPSDCDITSNCEKAFSYRVDGDILEMELFSVFDSTTRAYVAVGFSDDDLMVFSIFIFNNKYDILG